MIAGKLTIPLVVSRLRPTWRLLWPEGTAFPNALSLILFISTMAIGFANNSSSLLCNYDGAYFKTVSRLQHQWAPTIPTAASNPFAGVGDVFFPYHTQFSPAFGIAELIGRDTLNLTTLYSATALELSLAILFFGYTLRLPQTITLVAAWALPVMALPLLYFKGPVLYRIASLTPHRFELMAAMLVALAFFFRIGKSTTRAALGSTAAIFLLVVWIGICAPSAFILLVPTILLTGLVMLAGCNDRKELRTKIWCSLGLFAVSAPTVIAYFFGNYLYSTPAFFTTELIADRFVPQDLNWVSSLFHDKSRGLAGPYFIVAAFIGAAIAMWQGPKPMKLVGAVSLASLPAIIGGGVAVVKWWPGYRGPKPLYFEISFWPFYMLCAGYLIRAIGLSLTFAAGWLARKAVSGEPSPIAAEGRPVSGIPDAIAGLTIAIFCSLLVFCNPAVRRGQVDPLFMPPLTGKTALVDYLKEHTEIVMDGTFRGMTATFSGYSDHPEGIDWPDQFSNDMKTIAALGNDLRGMGLWHHHVPTLFQYNQFYSPTYYLMLTRLLTRPQDKQIRNMVVISQPHAEYLQSLGVRFVVSDYALPMPFETRMDETSLKLGSKLGLYELPHPNLGNYSPTEFIVTPDFRTAIETLQQPGFDFQRQAVVSESLSGDFTPATASEMRYEKGCVRISASSDGHSALLLPLQFSHCLQMTVRTQEGGQEPPSLVRMNVMQSALVFSGKVEVDIRYLNGPFHNPFGRLRDYVDFRDHWTAGTPGSAASAAH